MMNLRYRKRNSKATVKLAVPIALILTACIFLTFFILAKDEVKEGFHDVRRFVTTHILGTSEEAKELPRAKYTDETLKFSSEFTFTNAIAIDLNKNTVIAAKDAEKRVYPASITKVMTLVVALENIKDLDEKFTFTQEIIDPLILAEASTAGFVADESVSARDMLYGLMLPSGADAAVGLAILAAGSEEDFVELMNEKADELGLYGTHFMNPTGLHDDDHYSTCHDLALLLDYAIKNEAARETLITYQYTTEPTKQNPEGILLTDTMFSRMYGDESDSAFILGGKTGFTLEALHCLASFAVKCREGESEEAIYVRDPDFILVTVGSDNVWEPVFDAIDAYSSFSTGRGISDGVVNRLTDKWKNE